MQESIIQTFVKAIAGIVDVELLGRELEKEQSEHDKREPRALRVQQCVRPVVCYTQRVSVLAAHALQGLLSLVSDTQDDGIIEKEIITRAPVQEERSADTGSDIT